MKVISKAAFVVFALLSASVVLAEDVDVSSLPDSTLTGSQIAELFSGKKLSGKTTAGADVVFEFSKDGYVYINKGRLTDTGKWSVENDLICAKFRKSADACPVAVSVVAGKIQLGNLFLQK